MFLSRAFEKWLNESAFPDPGPANCSLWDDFRVRHRFAVHSEYLQSGGSPRYRKTCRDESKRASAVSARVRGGEICPHKNTLKEFPPTAVPNVLSAFGKFDPFASSVADGGLGWEKAGKSCAVVGSAPHLNGSNWGDDIDAHDVVIRINTAAVEGHESDLGSRTDVRITGENRIFYEDCDEIVFNNYDKPKYRMPWEVSWALPMEPVFNLPWSEACREHGVVMNGTTPGRLSWSSGMRGVCFALDLCEHVDIYGFGVPNTEGKFVGTYHFPSPYDVCGGASTGKCRRTKHPWLKEYLLRVRLNESKMACLQDPKPS